MIDFNTLTVPELRTRLKVIRPEIKSSKMIKAELVAALTNAVETNVASYRAHLTTKPNKTTRPYLLGVPAGHPLGEKLEVRDRFLGKEVIFGKGKRLALGKVISLVPRLQSSSARWLLVVMHPNGVTRSLHAPADVLV